MSGNLQVFGFEIDVHGARVVLEREPLCSCCMNDAEVAYNIDLLKKNLDRVGNEMKNALREQRTKPDF